MTDDQEIVQRVMSAAARLQVYGFQFWGGEGTRDGSGNMNDDWKFSFVFGGSPSRRDVDFPPYSFYLGDWAIPADYPLSGIVGFRPDAFEIIQTWLFVRIMMEAGCACYRLSGEIFALPSVASMIRRSFEELSSGNAIQRQWLILNAHLIPDEVEV